MANNFIFNPQFNFSLATLDKLNDEMKDCNRALKSHNVFDYLSSIEIFYKSTKPFLTQEQIIEVEKQWVEISKLSVAYGEDFIEYDDKLPKLLITFDFFLTNCLHKNGVSFSSKEVNKGLEYQYKKYGLDNKSD